MNKLLYSAIIVCISMAIALGAVWATHVNTTKTTAIITYAIHVPASSEKEVSFTSESPLVETKWIPEEFVFILMTSDGKEIQHSVSKQSYNSHAVGDQVIVEQL
jgi:hypothetical protein